MLPKENQESETHNSIIQKSDLPLEINQKYLYLDQSADLYYQSPSYEFLDSEFIKFVRRFIIEYKIKKLISLGCGNSFEELNILSKIKKTIEYTGIDFSQRMLELSKIILTENNFFNFKLIQSDFFEPKIYLKSKEKRMFYVSGYTMCNLNKDEWLNLLNNLKTKDYFIFYVLSIDDPFIYQDVIGDSIDNFCDNPIKINQYLKGLNAIGIKAEDGNFLQSISTDELSVVINYSFVLKNNKSVKVQDIRIYSIPKIIDFFDKSKFNLIHKKSILDTCLYIFQKE